MYVSEALQDLRFKIHDKDIIEMTDDELVNCLNEAIQYVSAFLVGRNSPIMVKDMEVTDEETTLPENFVKTAGVYPVKITGNTMKWLEYEAPEEESEETPSIKIRYFATCPAVTKDDDMPFAHDALNQATIKLAAIYCGNQLENEISQDKALLDEINAALSATIGAGIGGAVQ